MCNIDNYTFEFFRKKLETIERMLIEITNKEKIIMATEQDLQAVIAGIAQSQADEASKINAVSTALDAIIAKLSSSGTIPDADIQALTDLKTQLDASNTALQAAADKANAAVTPPPAPPAP